MDTGTSGGMGASANVVPGVQCLRQQDVGTRAAAQGPPTSSLCVNSFRDTWAWDRLHFHIHPELLKRFGGWGMIIKIEIWSNIEALK